MNAAELFDGLAAIEGSREAGSHGNGFSAMRLVNGVEYALATAVDERKLRAAWKRRKGGGAVPLVLISDDPEDPGKLRVLGPRGDRPVHRVRTEAMLDLVGRSAALNRLEAVRQVAQEVERLDTEGVAGLAVRGLGTEHLYGRRLRASPRWRPLSERAAGLPHGAWRDVLAALGYAIEELPRRGYLARAQGRPALVIHPQRSADRFARLDDEGRLPEGALLAACDAHGARYGMLAAGSRMRLLRAAADEGGLATRYLELDAAALEPEARPLLALLAPEYLVDGGLDALLAEARDHGAGLRLRLDRALRQDVLPVLGRELGRWAAREGRELADDSVREDLEAAALTWVFRALFLLYAESAGYLPMGNETYRQRSLTLIAQRAAEEIDSADPVAPTLWDDVQRLVDTMSTGQTAWGVPAYNGALFSEHGFAGAATLARARVADAALAPALVALARDPDDPDVGADFSGLEVGHLGHIYEGLLSLRLSVADRDYRYDAGADRYRPATQDEAEVRAGELLWLTNEGGRKGGGVYYTRSELVRHLVRESVRPAFERHLAGVRELAASDPAAAAARLFEFAVLDPACGSAHFLVEVADELADRIAELLGDLALPAVREALDSLKAAAGRTFGAGIEDTALLKRLVLKRCIYGVDLSPMGAEIAKVSLWLGSFVPGLSLAYLDHNVQTGNSLMGVARPEAVLEPEGAGGQIPLFADALGVALSEAAGEAARLRSIADRTPAEVEQSREADRELGERVAGARRVLDLWTAEGLGLAGARREALERGREVIEGQESLLADRAGEVAAAQRVLHWPLAFAEVFARERPGFDVVVGNPPWEEVNVDELGFYTRYRPGLRALPEAARLAALDALLGERVELPDLLGEERDRVAGVRRYLGPGAGYEGSLGNADLYKFFCQRYRRLLRPGGFLGVVLPRSAFSAKGSAGFREWLFESAAPRRIDFLLNAGRWAFDAEPRYTVSLLAAQAAAPKAGEAVQVAGVASSARAFRAQSERRGLRLGRSALGPAREIPLLASQAEADLLAKLRTGEPFPYGGGHWRCFPIQGDFNETTDRALWRDAAGGWPLWKGESFGQFDPHGAAARPCPPSEAALGKARKPRPGAGSLLATEVPVEARRAAVERAVGAARVAFRDVSRATDSRTVRACLVPPEHFLTNKAPYLAFVDGAAREQAACLALMNSLAFDWQARRFVETSLNFFILEGFRLSTLDDETFDALANAAARLSCPDERFAAFAAETGVEHGPLDVAERHSLRSEIDARVARAYGLDEDELELVLSDFTEAAVPSEYRAAVRARLAELG